MRSFFSHFSNLSLMGIIILALLLCLTIAGPLISGYAYDEMHLASKNLSPSPQFWFGTDDLGRDLFTRVCYGGRISLFVGLAAALIDLLIGVLWGSVSAFAGGRIDEVMMRTADVLYSLPYLLVVILLSIPLGTGLFAMVIAIAIIGWITMARIVRGQILLLKRMEYIQAAQVLGAGFGRIIFKHLLPNALGPILVTLTLTIPYAIFTEAFLSFLGLGVQAPMASWGTMASEGLNAMQYYPWRLFFPSFFISVTILGFTLLGEGIKEKFSSQEAGYQ